jgi:hypothetical protein
MDVDYLKKLSAHDRKVILSADAVEVIENTKFTKPLTPEEVAFYKSELSDNSILQSEILEEKKNVIIAFKGKLKPIQEKISQSLKAVKYKAIDCEGTLYKMADFDDQKIYTIDTDGNLINSRPMLPQERQFRIQALKSNAS